MSNKIPVNKLRLGTLKYFDKDVHGVEVSSFEAYAFLININGCYVNVLDIAEEEMPVFSRICYSNTTSSGDSYGTKLIHESGNMRSGMCYIIEDVDLERMFGDAAVSLEKIEDYVINSDKFFLNRMALLNRKQLSNKSKKKLSKTIMDDHAKLQEINDYFSERITGFQYFK